MGHSRNMPGDSISDNALLLRAGCSPRRGFESWCSAVVERGIVLSLLFTTPSASLLLHVLLMKLTLKHQLRPRPFTSMLGFLDLKTGVVLVVLFAVRTHSPLFYPALLTPFP